MRKAFLLWALMVFSAAQAQEKILYLDSCENFVSPNNYSIRRVTKAIPGKLTDVEFEDFDNKGRPVTHGLSGSRNGWTKKGDFEYTRADGSVIAKGSYEKGEKVGQWQYFRADGTPTTADDLIREMPTVKFVKDSVLESGSCLCYTKHGDWLKVDLVTRDTVVDYYEEGQVITINGGFLIVDKRAEFKDGMKSFYDYMKRIIRYPWVSRLNGNEGVAHFSFVVTEKGEVKKIKPLRSVDKATNKMIEKALKATSGRWRPALRKGREVSSYLVLPVIFDLSR